jgi:hypothetical protein
VSGFYADADAKGMAKLTTASGEVLLLVGNNSGAMKTYTVQQKAKQIAIEKDDVYSLLTRQNGSISKHEFYYGSTYLSQSSRKLSLLNDVISIEITNRKGASRKIKINPNHH